MPRFIGICASVMLLLAASVVQAEGARLSVSGEGVVEVAPDMAVIRLGVSETRASASDAVGAMSTALAAVLETLTAAGVADRDVQTSGLNLYPQTDYRGQDGPPKITGYVAQSDVTVRVRDLDALGSLLDQIVSEGANRLSGISFSVADPAPHLAEARRRAVADAQAKAEVLAQAAGHELGGLVSLSESTSRSGGGPVMMESSLARADVPVAAGEVGLNARVEMVWEITSP